MRRAVLLALAASACSGRATSSEPDPSDPPPPKIAHGAACGGALPGTCEAPYSCVELSTPHDLRCLQTCATECPAGEACLMAYDVCLEARPQYGACGDTYLQTCVESFCVGSACLPLCPASGPCPPVHTDQTSRDPTCHDIGGTGFCAVTVGYGEVCDEEVLRCNAEGVRPDTDAALEAAGIGQLDPGALSCLSTGATRRCLRVCSTDGGATQAPCGCPMGDPACAEPTSGAAWACVGISTLPATTHVCLGVEACADDTPCQDNTDGRTTCRATPYTGGPTMICWIP